MFFSYFLVCIFISIITVLFLLKINFIYSLLFLNLCFSFVKHRLFSHTIQSEYIFPFPHSSQFPFPLPLSSRATCFLCNFCLSTPSVSSSTGLPKLWEEGLDGDISLQPMCTGVSLFLHDIWLWLSTFVPFGYRNKGGNFSDDGRRRHWSMCKAECH